VQYQPPRGSGTDRHHSAELSRWLSGHTIPQPKHVRSIARFLQIPDAEARAMHTAMRHFADDFDRQDALLQHLDRLVHQLEDVIASSKQAVSVSAELVQLLIGATTRVGPTFYRHRWACGRRRASRGGADDRRAAK
jgi:hypothetical protein